MFEVTAASQQSESSPPFRPVEVEHFLQTLSPDERETIILKIYNDFSFQEIANLRQVHLSTVASWYRRGLDELRAFLNKEPL